MARYRSRRTTRRTASQTAASLLALALPAPVQRVADTRVGPLLMLVGVPTMLALGLLNIDWSNGTPNLSIDQRRASELHHATRETINKFDTQGGLQGLGQAATDLINQAQSYAQNPYGSNPYAQDPYSQNPYANPSSTSNLPAAHSSTHAQSQPAWPTRNSGAAFPSTQPTTTASNANQQNWRTTSQQIYSQPTYAQQTQQPTAHAQQTVIPSPPITSRPIHNQAMRKNSYAAQAASPSDHQSAAAYQQQLLYQQQQQQQLYEQQLRAYQYQQWLAQQQATQQPTYGATQQQTDAYGRPVNTGNWQTSPGYAAPNYSNSQFGSQGTTNYNQGTLPIPRGYR